MATDPVRAAAEGLIAEWVKATPECPITADLIGAIGRLRAVLAADCEPAGEPCWESFWKERYDEQHRNVHAMEDEIARLRVALAAALSEGEKA